MWAFPAQMMPAGVKTGGTQRDSTISQPHDSGVQALSWSSSAGGGFPWRSWRAFLQAEIPRGSRGHPLTKCHRMVTPDLPPSLGQGAQIKGSSMSPTGSPALSLLTQGSLLPGQAGHGIGDVWLWTPTAQGRSRNAVGTHVLENQPVPILQLRQLHVIGDLVLCVPQGTPEAAAAQELL